MKRIYFQVLAIFLFSVAGFAQKGNNAIGAGGDMGFPTGQFGDEFKPGVGMYAKGMLGVGKAGQVTFSSGYMAFKKRETWQGFSATLNQIPLLLGYRHNFNAFFVEPQLGYSIIGAKIITVEDETFTESDGIFIGAANIGYVFNKQIEISARYQTGGKNGTNLGLFGIRLGYNFSSGHSK